MLTVFLSLATLHGATIQVPADRPTMKDAVASAAPGDVIILSPGTYTETNISIDKQLTIASQYHVTGDKAFIQKTILQGGNKNIFTVVKIAGAGTQIIGLTFTKAYKPVIIHAKCTVKRCVFTDNGGDSISFEKTGYGTIMYNTIEHSSDDGIDIDGTAKYYKIKYNTIRNNGDDGIEIRLFGYSGKTIPYTIKGNTITGNEEDGIQLIDYSDISDRIFIITGNILAANAMAGLGCMPDGDSKENYGGSSMKERVCLFNNTIVGNTAGVTGADNIIALNNIVANNSMVGIKKVKADSIIGYSIFYQNGAHITKSVTGDGILLDLDPKYNSKYCITDGSPCIDRGTAFFQWRGETVLQIDSWKGAAPDIGAYEYQ